MKAKELLDKYVKEEVRGEVGVIAIGFRNGKGEVFWYHVHEDEEVPEEGFDIALHIRNVLPTPAYRKAYKEAFGKNKRLHVISRGKKWGVKKEDKSRASRLYDEKADAINHAERLRKEEGYETIVHNKDGSVQNLEKRKEKHSYKITTRGVKTTISPR